MKKLIKKFYYEGELISKEYPSIINEDHFNRLLKLMDDGEIIFGGESNFNKKIIDPTLLESVALDSPLMKEEIFGPLLPLIPIEGLAEANWGYYTVLLKSLRIAKKSFLRRLQVVPV